MRHRFQTYRSHGYFPPEQAEALYAEYRNRAEAFVDVLGDGHSISYGALGIHWWRVIAEGPPGLTLRGGLPNVNQAIGRAVDRILSLPAASNTDETRTRLNISMQPSMSESGSANLNVAIGAGTRAIGLGGARGGDRGLPTEWADIDGMMRTAKHVLLLASTLGGVGGR